MTTTEGQAPARGPRWLEYLPVEDLVPDPRNPKNHAERDLDASLDRFGFTEPIMLDERTGRLVAGHGRRLRVLAARDQGREAPEGVVVDEEGRWLVPVNRGWSSADDVEAGAYLVASNRLTEKGGWHDAHLAAILEEVASGPGLDGVGYDQAEMAALLESVTASAPTPPEEFRRVDETLETEHECPRCGYQFSGAAKPSEPEPEGDGGGG